MTWSADRLLAAGAAVLALSLGIARGAGAVPAALDASVRAAVATRANVAIEDVRIEWSAAAAKLAACDSLVGVKDGIDGWTSATVALGGDRLAMRLRVWIRAAARLAARPIAAGTTLDAADIADVVQWNPWSVAAPRARAEAGWDVRRPLAAGARLEWPSVAPGPAVAPGEHVVATWVQGGVAVKIEGVALEGARAGRPVRFRPSNGGQSLAAIAVAPGEVRLSGRSER